MHLLYSNDSPSTGSLSRKLAFSLIGAVVLMAFISGGLLYVYAQQNARQTLEALADQTLAHLSSALASPLWNYSNETVIVAAKTLMASHDVTSLLIVDDAGESLFSEEIAAEPGQLVRESDIHFEGTMVGKVRFTYSTRVYREQVDQFLDTSIFILLVVVFTIGIITQFLLRVLLKNPIGQLTTMANHYESGDYCSSTAAGYNEFLPLLEILESMGQRIGLQLAELRKNEVKYRRIFESIEDGYLLVNMHDSILSVNPATVKLLKYDSPTRLEGKNIAWDVYANPQDHDTLKATLRKKGLVNGYLLQLKQQDGREVVADCNFRLICDEVDEPVAIEGTFRDVTERMRVEEELKAYREHLEELVNVRTRELNIAKDHAEASSRSKSIFLANMSHELRTPLNAILGFSDILRRDPEISKTHLETLAIIHKSGDHLLGLINEVLDLAKIEAGRIVVQPAAFDFDGTIHDITDMLRIRAQDKGLQLLLDYSSKLPRFIISDQAKLRQILINLISNAIEATAIGSVTLRISVERDDVERLIVEVEDTGSGIAPEDQARIMEAFVQVGSQSEQQGTGLGLAISHGIVELMGGNLTFTSRVDKGSIFRVELPLQRTYPEDLPVAPEARGEVTGLEAGQPNYRALVVDDKEDNRILLMRLMQNVGFQVKLAENGAEAAEKFTTWQPDFIWMDRRMPGMDGLEATRRIRGLPGGAEVKIAAVTASSFKENDAEMIRSSFDAIVHKPFRPDEIFDCMEQLLGLSFVRAGTSSKRAAAAMAAAPECAADVMATVPEFSAAAMSTIPEALRTELREALILLGEQRIKHAIDAIGQTEPGLAEVLHRQASNLAYEVILSHLEDGNAH